MALETERTKPMVGLGQGARDQLRAIAEAFGPLAAGLQSIGRRLARTPLMRFISSSLLRRIFVSNLLGLLILLIGLLYLSQHNAWLIDAKRESLRAQGEIIAAAIAANATVETERIVLDPERLPESEGARIPFQDDGFHALELSIRPERITPILRRLVAPTTNRARIYGRDGTLIADSARLLSRGQISRSEIEAPPETRPKTKSFWTRLTKWVRGSQLPVYREIGSAKGTAYIEVRMAMSGGLPTPMLLLTEQGETIVSIAVPIQRNRAVQGVLLLSTRPGDIDDILEEERLAILTLAALALLAMLAASALLARTVAGPMRRLSDTAERVSHNITARQQLPDFPDRTDEVGQMAKAFREMTAALYRRIEASEKFAADVAHELKNPLTAARSTAESLAYARSDDQRQHLVDQIQTELRRLNRLITDVSNASRLDAELALQQTVPVDLTIVLQGVVDTFADVISEDSRKVILEVTETSFETPFVVKGHEGRLAQVVTNLLDNALSFSPEAGLTTVRLCRRGGFIEIEIDDEGPGIDHDNLEKVFERFYTYRPSCDASRGKNSGLGLSISREIVRALGGEIWAENRYAHGASGGEARLGARFVVRLPAAKPGLLPLKHVAGRGRHV